MCINLPPGDLNPDACLPHPASTYACGVIIILKVYDGSYDLFNKLHNLFK